MEFEWNTGNLSHIAEHGMTAPEVEAILENPGTEFSAPYTYAGEWRVSATGSRSDGRIAEVIFTQLGGLTRVVTSYPASQRTQRDYRERHP